MQNSIEKLKKQCILWYSGEGEEPFPQDYNITMKCKADAGILLEEIVDLFMRGIVKMKKYLPQVLETERLIL